jgi:UDP-N-acetylmuramoyl-tripeptide--D-alanyl-D-alanine ligase
VIPLELNAIEALGLGQLERLGPIHATGVQVDSRRIEPGDLFVVVGEGGRYVDDARDRRAAAVLVPDDAFGALEAIGRLVRDRSRARFVGITGSMGKTSTKDILAALIHPHARVVAAERSYNNEIGVPLTLCRLEEDTEICILELAMRGLGQIAELAALTRPDVGVITTIAPVHLEKLGSLARIAEAKSELIDALPPGGTAVVPADAADLTPLLRREDVRLLRVGEGGDIVLRRYEPMGERARLDAEVAGEHVAVQLPFNVRHQTGNVLLALAAYHALDLPLGRVQDGADKIAFSLWRGEELPLPGGGFLINDVWNANPLSMRAALEHLAVRAGDRRSVAVLGQMAELGPDAPAYHVEVGEAAAAAGIDALLAIGPLATGYLDGAAGRVPGTRHVETLDQALAALQEFLQPGDAVLVKGARALGLEAVAETLAGTAA